MSLWSNDASDFVEERTFVELHYPQISRLPGTLGQFREGSGILIGNPNPPRGAIQEESSPFRSNQGITPGIGDLSILKWIIQNIKNYTKNPSELGERSILLLRCCKNIVIFPVSLSKRTLSLLRETGKITMFLQHRKSKIDRSPSSDGLFV